MRPKEKLVTHAVTSVSQIRNDILVTEPHKQGQEDGKSLWLGHNWRVKFLHAYEVIFLTENDTN